MKTYWVAELSFVSPNSGMISRASVLDIPSLLCNSKNPQDGDEVRENYIHSIFSLHEACEQFKEEVFPELLQEQKTIEQASKHVDSER